MAINVFPLIVAFLISQFPVWEGVIVKSVKLKDGNHFLSGDRVLVIKKETEQTQVFTADDKFYQLDSSYLYLINKWVPQSIKKDYFSPNVVKFYNEPNLKSEWITQQLPDYINCIYFSNVIFNEKENIFWGSPYTYNKAIDTVISIRWIPFTLNQTSKLISTFIPKNDSLRAEYLDRLGDLFIETPTKSLNFYNLAYEWSEKANYKDCAANSLLMLARVYFDMKDQKKAKEILDSVIHNYSGIKCMVGRADAYATFKLLEFAQKDKDTAKVCSLAKFIIFNFPNEDGLERVIGGSGWYAHWLRSPNIWFDIAAANMLMDMTKENDEKLVENANLLIASTNTAVKLIGYENLISYYYRKYEQDIALFYAKGAVVLPHYRKWETKVHYSDMIVPDEWVDFKEGFMNKLDSLLPLSYLIQLYDFAYNQKDTSVAKDAARWFIDKIEQGRLPPKSDLTEKITSDDDKDWFKQAFLSSIDTGYIFRITSPCTLYNKQKNPEYWKAPTFPFKKILNKGDKICLFFFEDSSIRVKVNDSDNGWFIDAKPLKGNYQFTDFPAASIPRPVLYYDITKDGIKDLELENGTIINGKSGQLHCPALKGAGWVGMGFLKDYFLITNCDSIWVRDYKGLNINRFCLNLKEKEDKSNPFTSFFYGKFIRDEDTVAWFFAGDEKGFQWIHSLKLKGRERFNFYQVDTNVILYNLNRIIFISSRKGKINWQIEFAKQRSATRSGSDIFINQDGFVLFESDSIVYRDFTGKVIFAIKNEGYSNFPPLPLFPSLPKWGKMYFCPFLPKIPSKYIPAIKERTLTLISVKDGTPYKSFVIPENIGEFFYDGKGFYVSRKSFFRAYDWDGNPIKTINLPYISFPIWENDKILFYWSQPLGILLNSKFAEKFK
jgi:tetratricopeptide (TPR) repeat protein